MPNKNTAKKGCSKKRKTWVEPTIEEIVIKELEELAACGKTCSFADPCYSCSGYSS